MIKFRNFLKLVLINVLFFQFSFGISYASSLQPAQPTLENFILDNLINDTIATIKIMVEKNEFPELKEKTSKYKKLRSAGKEILARNPDFLKTLQVTRKGSSIIVAVKNDTLVIEYSNLLRTGFLNFGGKNLDFSKLHDLSYINRKLKIQKTSSILNKIEGIFIREANAIAWSLAAEAVVIVGTIVAGAINLTNKIRTGVLLQKIENMIGVCQSDLSLREESNGKIEFLQTHYLLDLLKLSGNLETLTLDYRPGAKKFWGKILDYFEMPEDAKSIEESYLEFEKCLSRFNKLDEERGRSFNSSRKYEKKISEESPYSNIIQNISRALKN